jgi:hypothetical protein
MFIVTIFKKFPIHLYISKNTPKLLGLLMQSDSAITQVECKFKSGRDFFALTEHTLHGNCTIFVWQHNRKNCLNYGLQMFQRQELSYILSADKSRVTIDQMYNNCSRPQNKMSEKQYDV